MIIVSKNNILIPSEDQSMFFPVHRGWMGEAPGWATNTQYFRDLVADGKIIVSESRRDRDLQAADEAGTAATKKRRKAYEAEKVEEEEKAKEE